MEEKDWTGFAAHMLPLPSSASPEDRARHSKQMLLRALSLRTTIAVVGSGCSVPRGYPTWLGFAEQVLGRTIKAVGERSAEGRRLLDYRKTLNTNTRQDLIMFYLGACQDVLDRCGKKEVYTNYILETFSAKEAKKDQDNPYENLVNLPIHRFVTTNYDMEIEMALVKAKRVNPGTFESRTHLTATWKLATYVSPLVSVRNTSTSWHSSPSEDCAKIAIWSFTAMAVTMIQNPSSPASTTIRSGT